MRSSSSIGGGDFRLEIGQITHAEDQAFLVLVGQFVMNPHSNFLRAATGWRAPVAFDRQ